MAPITHVETPLRAALREQGRMQKWLAEQVGCHPSEISDYVRGVHVPSDATQRAIARALRRKRTDLFPVAVAERSAA